MAAGPAAVTAHILSQWGVDEDAPCADGRFLVPLKRSAAFRGLRPRLAGRAPHKPVDAWQDGEFHLFVFELTNGVAADRPVAVFAMHPGTPDHPVSAVTVTPLGDGEAEIRDLHEPATVYRTPMPGAPSPN